MPPPTPPPFATPTYWDARFRANPTSFDWLLPASSLDGPLIDALNASPAPSPRVLHVGCGTSVLSLHLRAHVQDPRQVHNVDFSRVSVELGARWEREVFEGEGLEREREEGAEAETEATGGKTPPRMRWSTLDLLSLPAVLALLSQAQAQAQNPSASAAGAYDLIVDKSTCDAIACGEDIPVALPYPIQPTSTTHTPHTPAPQSPSPTSSLFNSPSATPAPSTPTNPNPRTHPIHPIHLLAVHLSLLTPPKARWIALSYSASRFPWLEPLPTSAAEGLLSPEVLGAGFPDPGRLWRLVGRERVVVDEGGGKGGHGGVVHRPEIGHWLYVFERTGEGVGVVGEGVVRGDL
ncbi:uncharacterized protein K452DRAFT_284172 [Aplosporella prunicola CBS 121167]|uniref:Methyltransferase domain-containing protein n=1 Tax=Aplosporella prunicola CBS 121167 TaxID=1176127 RepID=A0A6A6BPX6_9PEZI|nr:uncharacterized protein K452DRAFT_284172 [Aplosporella prunicola CBS 121167]KAF2145788.1 hypothetical protein K452DRAFT_284172 [Aplosporella prunicola CBS 121167]